MNQATQVVSSDSGRQTTLGDRVHVPWKRSLTAGINAHFRMRETMRPEGQRILEDRWANLLADDHPILRTLATLERWVPGLKRMASEQATTHCVRHASIDALVREAMADRPSQVVIVGAGYDMRATRIGGGLGWFEIDRAPIAARKAMLLEGRTELGPVRQVHVDLITGDLQAELTKAGWVSAQPTVFVVEGLIHYFQRPLIESLLAQMSTGGPRRVVLSWIAPEMSRRAGAGFRESMRVLGELPREFFSAAELRNIFAANGLGTFRAWDYAEQVRDFAPLAAGRDVGLSQEIGIAS